MVTPHPTGVTPSNTDTPPLPHTPLRDMKDVFKRDLDFDEKLFFQIIELFVNYFSENLRKLFQ